MTDLITRKEYLQNSSELHNKYYSQFINDFYKGLVLKSFGKEKLLNAYKEDKNLNSIALYKWDSLASFITLDSSFLKLLGETNTLAVKVCILKACARDIINN